ncbi:MAG: O-antigen ligase family protein [bacterium]|nr:O-antigen ligase family protein [bacterium]
MNKNKVVLFFDIAFLALFTILLVGIPLVFTSYTRSVFEVNKMLLMRYVTMITYVLWLFRYILLKDSGFDNSADESFNITGFKWKKTGIEIPVLIWLVINILSTIFSQNIKVAIIGAYDRWEGIITIFNYMMLFMMFVKLTTRRLQVQFFLAAILGSSIISAAYGIYQSLGRDFMRWSVDPTKRVFACINNPVHFCAYMAMVVPLGLGWILYFVAKDKNRGSISIWHETARWLIFISISICFYAQFLSFSKATWLGFVGSMTLFYLFVTRDLNIDSPLKFFTDFFISSIAIGSYYMTDLFNLHKKHWIIGLIIFMILSGYILYSYFFTQKSSRSLKERRKELAYVILSSVVLYITFNYNLAALNKFVSIPVYLCLAAYFIILSLKVDGLLQKYFSRIVIIFLFAKLQFVAISITNILLYTLLTTGYIFLLKKNTLLKKETVFWLSSFLIISALIIIIPSIPIHLSSISNDKEPNGGLKVLQNVQGRLVSYANIAIAGSARTSMWKSSFPWIRDYWLLGSGPDTVKYMYPKYRRSEYGILEGGHNYTPDRLHNEYLNTLATRGILGFVSYYLIFITGWYLLVLSGLIELNFNRYSYIAIGIVTGASIYLGQVFFNFGVVATLVLFYSFMGIGLAIVHHPDFRVKDEEEEN